MAVVYMKPDALAPPFWERQRGDGPITRVIERRKRDEERFEYQRQKLRRPERYVFETAGSGQRVRP
jgi:hypothetical protein